MTQQEPSRVGTPVIAYFSVTGRPLRRLTPTMRGPLDHPWPADAGVEVRLTVFEADGRLFVGQVEVLTVPQGWDTPYGEVHPPAVEPLTINTDIWRAIPLGKLIDEAIAGAQTEEEARLLSTYDEAAYERLNAAVKNAENAKSRRGRPAAATPQQTAAAVSAYLRGGNRGVLAAQRALEEAGLPGNGEHGVVTREQAKKVIAKARKDGLLPPAHRTQDKRGD